MLDALKSDVNVMNDIAPSVVVNGLGESSVELLALPYALVGNYWDVYWGTRERVLMALGEAGFKAPHPKRVVTMQQ